MRFSKMAIKTSKNIGSNDSFVTEFLLQAGEIKQFTAGLYGFGPLMTKAKQKLDNLVRKHLENYDCVEISLPLLQSKKYWTNSGRWEAYYNSGNMFHTKGRNGEYAICPTAEELSTEYMNSVINSYKDLDVIVYQIGTKFRDEIRVQGGLLRTKEFSMMDAYSFDDSYENMMKNYEKMYNCYLDIFKELELDVIPVRAVNTMGGKVSDEFMCVDDNYGQDTILYSKELNIGLNTEILEDESLKEHFLKTYPNVDINSFESLKAVELGHIFQNNTYYSEMMNGKFMDKTGKTNLYYNGCYGIGMSRVLTLTIIKSFEKYNKFIWNDAICPYKVYLANLPDKVLNEKAEEIYKTLKQNNIECIFDDRDVSLGVKLKDNELNGIRYNMIIGKKFLENNLVEIEDRKTNQKEFMTIDDAVMKFKH